MAVGTEFLTFATGGSAVIETQADYNAGSYRTNGFQDGIAITGQVNKVWHQSAMVSAALTTYVTNIINQLVVDDNDFNKLTAYIWQAFLGDGYFIDTGSAGALSVGAPAGLTFLSPFAGLHISVKVANTCNGTTTFNWCGTGAVAVTFSDGTQLLPGSYNANAIITLLFDGTKWQLVAGQTTLRYTTGTPIIYVRSDGNDTHDGSVNSAGKALLTLDAALNLAKKYFTSGGSVTIQLGITGTYAAPTTIPPLSTPIVISGDTSNPANYVISGAGSATAVFNVIGSNVTFSGVTLSNLANSYNLVSASAGGVVTFAFTQLTAVGGNTKSASVAFAGGSLILGVNVFVTANFGYLLNAIGGDVSILTGGSVTAVGTPAFASATVNAQDGGRVILNGATLTGPATGVRYLSNSNGVIDTGGGGAGFIFGNSAGSVATGGIYV